MPDTPLLQESLFEFRLITNKIFPRTCAAMFFRGTELADTRIGVARILADCRHFGVSIADYCAPAQNSYRWLTQRKNVSLIVRRGWLWSPRYAANVLAYCRENLPAGAWVDYDQPDTLVVQQFRGRLTARFGINLGSAAPIYALSDIMRSSDSPEQFVERYKAKLELLRGRSCRS